MNKLFLLPLFVGASLFFSALTYAEPITINDTDTTFSVLTAQIGNRITIQTKSGNELTGTVKSVNENVTHLAALSGKEFYDAVIKNKNIEAIIIRTK